MALMKPLVIYHDQCRDGFAAAWVAWRNGYKDAEFFAASHGQPPPDVAGRDVLMTDFSYPADTLRAMALRAKSLTIYDHHKTAEEPLNAVRNYTDTHVVFDGNRSGAGITWDELDGGPRPWLVDYVEDRDLWRHKLPDSETVNAFIATLLFDFQTWDDVARYHLDQVSELGQVALAKTTQYVAEVSKNVRMVTFDKRTIPCVNAPQVDISELLQSLVKQHPPIALGWFQRADGMFVYSLRGDGSVDVSEIAKRFGGGGHHNAAGFQLFEMLTL